MLDDFDSSNNTTFILYKKEIRRCISQGKCFLIFFIVKLSFYMFVTIHLHFIFINQFTRMFSIYGPYIGSLTFLLGL